MYPYHNRIKQRIAQGELEKWYLDDDFRGMGPCLVLIFCTPPAIRFVRPHSYWRYEGILEGLRVSHGGENDRL